MFNAINNCGLAGNLTVNVISDVTETGAVALNQWTGSNTLTIQPSDATEKLISGTNASAELIRFYGADNVTIDGRYNGSGQYLRFKRTDNLYATMIFDNGSSNNTIKYCKIERIRSGNRNRTVRSSSG